MSIFLQLLNSKFLYFSTTLFILKQIDVYPVDPGLDFLSTDGYVSSLLFQVLCNDALLRLSRGINTLLINGYGTVGDPACG